MQLINELCWQGNENDTAQIVENSLPLNQIGRNAVLEEIGRVLNLVSCIKKNCVGCRGS
jgi:hypothetical protein